MNIGELEVKMYEFDHLEEAQKRRCIFDFTEALVAQFGTEEDTVNAWKAYCEASQQLRANPGQALAPDLQAQLDAWETAVTVASQVALGPGAPGVGCFELLPIDT